jgi:hypothetical protein
MSDKFKKKEHISVSGYLSQFLLGKNVIAPFMDSLAANYGYEEIVEI